MNTSIKNNIFYFLSIISILVMFITKSNLFYITSFFATIDILYTYFSTKNTISIIKKILIYTLIAAIAGLIRYKFSII